MSVNIDGIRKVLENAAKDKAKSLAIEAREQLTNKYASLISRFYSDYDPVRYIRTGNLNKSYKKYYKNPHNTIIYGGVEVTYAKMHDYPSNSQRRDPISAERLLDKFIYSPSMPSATWHGGNMHGGYGIMASFSIYYELQKYYMELKQEFINRCTP